MLWFCIVHLTVTAIKLNFDYILFHACMHYALSWLYSLGYCSSVAKWNLNCAGDDPGRV